MDLRKLNQQCEYQMLALFTTPSGIEEIVQLKQRRRNHQFHTKLFMISIIILTLKRSQKQRKD